jgi:hypothetical protein
MTILFLFSTRMNRIIAHLSRDRQGDVYTLGIVQVSASRTTSELRNVIDLRERTYIVLWDEPMDSGHL